MRFEILMLSGALVDVLAPEPDTILVEDLVRCLTNEYRFSGNTTYPVSAHSLVVAALVEPYRDRASGGEGKLLRTAALVHDGSEAYCKDLPRDVKHAMDSNTHEPNYRSLERGFMRAIWRRFGLLRADGVYIPELARVAGVIKRADDDALAAEVELLWPSRLRHHFRCKRASELAVRETLRYAQMTREGIEATFRHELEAALPT